MLDGWAAKDAWKDPSASPQVRAELLRVATQRIAKLQTLTEAAERTAGTSVKIARCRMTSERPSPPSRHSGTPEPPLNRRLSALLHKASLLNRASSPRTPMASAKPTRPPSTCLPPPICTPSTTSLRPPATSIRSLSFCLSSARRSSSPELSGAPRSVTRDRPASNILTPGDKRSRPSSITTVQRLQSLSARSPPASEIGTSPQPCSPAISCRISHRSCSPDETGWGREVGGDAAGEAAGEVGEAEGGDGGALGGGLEQQLCDLDRELEVALGQSGDRRQVGNCLG